MVIRESRLADIERMAVMAEHFIQQSEYATKLALNPAQIRHFAERCLSGQAGECAILVSEVEGELTGMIGVLVAAHPFSGERIGGDLFWWVEPAHRGHGIRLMRAAEVWAQARGAVAFQMVAPNDRVGQLYRRCGYAPLEQTFQRSL